MCSALMKPMSSFIWVIHGYGGFRYSPLWWNELVQALEGYKKRVMSVLTLDQELRLGTTARLVKAKPSREFSKEMMPT
ncbi:hypothetical protein TanjilG_22238 [Lupinus angustifolius]|uniref:Uncharacterized protein n=1 Tax=Lupinus angustifolius TaxID=3871 RepID=A0A1J7I3Z5_LUPAN|nr:hypothetical protein TanjilG_22238 [Lupinus angustifolius]